MMKGFGTRTHLGLKDSGLVQKRGIALLLFGLSLCLPASALPADKWTGVDEAVVEKIAKEHGREARKPLIDPGEGDLLLFVFLVAGVAGGFAAGYSWRMLVSEKRKEEGT